MIPYNAQHEAGGMAVASLSVSVGPALRLQ